MEHLRQDGRQGEHLGRQVGEVSQDEDEAWLDDLDVLSASGQQRDQQAKHEPNEGTTERHHKEGNWSKKERDRCETLSSCYSAYYITCTDTFVRING